LFRSKTATSASNKIDNLVQVLRASPYNRYHYFFSSSITAPNVGFGIQQLINPEYARHFRQAASSDGEKVPISASNPSA
jgi:hypothetical protein